MDLLPLIARAGYAARGAVYLIVGAISVLAAFELRERPIGARGSLEVLATWPGGPLLLLVLGTGLSGFAIWRVVQALLDTEDLGRSAIGLVHRLGLTGSGTLYGLMGWSALEGADSLEDLVPRNLGAEALQGVLESWIAEELLLGVAAFAALAGLGNALKALSRHLMTDLSCPRSMQPWVAMCGRVGYGTRAALLLLLAERLGVTALDDSRALHLVTLGEVLAVLEPAPESLLLLAGAGAGLFCFGAFGMAEALWRGFRERPVEDRDPHSD
ncbi:DUF1206 domain-containing protein [Falsiroseomonas tokyonensis]|uniref:DUF1206 domain-containing protein n=1 Tax=Falsiroseomonas tokyonensis TaxID=430521 RepID=A0ABV7BRC8_9PROT|nr:DUF1206 domain-containing protein [Falsiroseomonas tokyonensis]MBU8536618.1 DUF1206 domain-containing protein [Falsiroseomonas tokyonensis]